MIPATQWARKKGVQAQTAKDWARRGSLGAFAERREITVVRWYIDSKCKGPNYKRKPRKIDPDKT